MLDLRDQVSPVLGDDDRPVNVLSLLGGRRTIADAGDQAGVGNVKLLFLRVPVGACLPVAALLLVGQLRHAVFVALFSCRFEQAVDAAAVHGKRIGDLHGLRIRHDERTDARPGCLDTFHGYGFFLVWVFFGLGLLH